MIHRLDVFPELERFTYNLTRRLEKTEIDEFQRRLKTCLVYDEGDLWSRDLFPGFNMRVFTTYPHSAMLKGGHITYNNFDTMKMLLFFRYLASYLKSIGCIESSNMEQ